jgi:hypothetical protein
VTRRGPEILVTVRSRTPTILSVLREITPDQAFRRRLGAGGALGSAAAGSFLFPRPPETGNNIAGCRRSAALAPRAREAGLASAAVGASLARLRFSASISRNNSPSCVKGLAGAV